MDQFFHHTYICVLMLRHKFKQALWPAHTTGWLGTKNFVLGEKTTTTVEKKIITNKHRATKQQLKIT